MQIPRFDKDSTYFENLNLCGLKPLARCRFCLRAAIGDWREGQGKYLNRSTGVVLISKSETQDVHPLLKPPSRIILTADNLVLRGARVSTAGNPVLAQKITMRLVKLVGIAAQDMGLGQ
jgi:hypothetical protein